ncbi:nuclear transport factor 2 family protein [Nocardiopsis sp. FIRDI 009]|uniref:nuclear transport factor 2 family protein n=1 Tax=Nocardiopsis sp. FIRDI 009 TaxID=714197 RepID=UPI001E5EAB7D|nr:nuclear transport factor 2 family protein [Nocardiopsis sp. FIRDI 009]
MSKFDDHPNVRTAVRYHEAVSRFAGPEELASFLHPDLVHTQLPNTLFPTGTVRDLSEVVAASKQGGEMLAHQHFEVTGAVASGDRVALEATWFGTLAVPLGGLPAGHVLRAHVAAFLDFRDGRIVAQRNYDCYEPVRSEPPGEGARPGSEADPA